MNNRRNILIAPGPQGFLNGGTNKSTANIGRIFLNIGNTGGSIFILALLLLNHNHNHNHNNKINYIFILLSISCQLSWREETRCPSRNPRLLNHNQLRWTSRCGIDESGTKTTGHFFQCSQLMMQVTANCHLLEASSNDKLNHGSRTHVDTVGTDTTVHN
jgi:hypothetical protein